MEWAFLGLLGICAWLLGSIAMALTEIEKTLGKIDLAVQEARGDSSTQHAIYEKLVVLETRLDRLVEARSPDSPK